MSRVPCPVCWAGSGKTHTMMGNLEAGPGVMVLSLRDLYKRIEERNEDREYKVRNARTTVEMARATTKREFPSATV